MNPNKRMTGIVSSRAELAKKQCFILFPSPTCSWTKALGWSSLEKYVFHNKFMCYLWYTLSRKRLEWKSMNKIFAVTVANGTWGVFQPELFYSCEILSVNFLPVKKIRKHICSKLIFPFLSFAFHRRWFDAIVRTVQPKMR